MDIARVGQIRVSQDDGNWTTPSATHLQYLVNSCNANSSHILGSLSAILVGQFDKHMSVRTVSVSCKMLLL
jgi:hypothetical protein